MCPSNHFFSSWLMLLCVLRDSGPFQGHEDILLFSSKGFIAFSFTFRSMQHLEWTFLV